MDDDQTRHPGEKEEPKSSCKDCCERVAWSSLVAAIITVIGVVLVVVCVGLNSRIAGPLFSNTVIENPVYTWFSWIQIGAYVGLVLMVAMVFILSSSGCMATGYQNASTWCAFNKAQTGRRQLTAFMIVAYVVNLGWYVFTFGAAMPTIFFMMLNNGVCTNTAYTDSTCLDLRQFGLASQSLPAAVNSTLICAKNLQDICESSLGSNFILGLIGCILILVGMNHFMMSISGNYNWLRLRKRRQKIMAGQMNRRSGTYDLNTSPYVERQDSRDSNAHLRRVNLHHGSSSNILTSSTTSIPTVAANVPPVVITTSSTFAMPPSSSSSKKDPPSNSSSMQSSKISNQTYGFDDGGFSQPSSASARVTFADSKPTSAVAPRSNTTASKRSTAEDKNDLSKYADRSFENSTRYDHFNPAFDENYWDRQQYDRPPQEQPKFDNYYSRSYSNPSKMNGSARNYDQGNFNQAYYNYDYDAADGGGFQLSPRSKSTYGKLESSQPVAADTKATGNAQTGRYQTDATPTSFYGQDSSKPSAQNWKETSYKDAGGYNMNAGTTYGQDSSQPLTQSRNKGGYKSNLATSYGQERSQWDAPNTNASGTNNGGPGYRTGSTSSASYGQGSAQSLAQDRKEIGNNVFEYQL